MVGGKLGIDKGRTKKIDRDFCLREKIAPKTWRKLAVTSRQDSSGVVFEGANRALHLFSMVIASISELKLEILGSDGHTHAVGGLIVEFMEISIDISCLQFDVASIVTLDQVVVFSTFHRMDKDGIGIMVIEKEDVVHVTGGGEREAA